MALTLTDQIKSLRRFLRASFPNVPIHLERDRNEFERPALLIEHIQTTTNQIMPKVFEDVTPWQISYFTASKMDAMEVADRIARSLNESYGIPAYLFDYKHPAPTIVEAIAGDLVAGIYQVQVTGIGRDGSESLPSDPMVITIAGSGAIHIRIPRLFLGIGPFRKYGVYVNGKRQAIVVQDDVGHTDYGILTLPAVDAPAPPVKAAVLERSMRVENVMTHTLEEENDGRHMGIVRVQTRLTVPKSDAVADKLAGISMKILG